MGWGTRSLNWPGAGALHRLLLLSRSWTGVQVHPYASPENLQRASARRAPPPPLVPKGTGGWRDRGMAGSGGGCQGKVTSTERRLPDQASAPVGVSGSLAMGHQPTDSDVAGPPVVARLGDGSDRVPASPRIDWELPKPTTGVPGLWTTADWVQLPRRTGRHVKVPHLSAGA